MSTQLETSCDLASRFERDGYLAVPDAFAAEELAELRAEAVRICRGALGEIPGVVPAGADESDDDVLARYLCIHHPHKTSELAARYLAHPAIVDVLLELDRKSVV